jgi:hypothetical protein
MPEADEDIVTGFAAAGSVVTARSDEARDARGVIPDLQGRGSDTITGRIGPCR